MDNAEAPPPSNSVDWMQRFEGGRRDNIVFGFAILGPTSPMHRTWTWLDDVKPEDLPDLADDVITAHAARMAIKSVARVEAAVNTQTKQGLGNMPADGLVQALMSERDKAVDFYQQFRARKAKTARLEALAGKARVIPFPHKPKQPRVRLRKVETA